MSDGAPEGFLLNSQPEPGATRPIGSNGELVKYLLANQGYYIVQHGLRHDFHEFDDPCRTEVARRLDRGTQLLREAGFPAPQAFVAPYDRLSRASLREVAGRFRILSTGWFELNRLPITWWPGYAIKKLRAASHWRVGRTLLLTHPGCMLSCHRDYGRMLDQVVECIQKRQLTVLVTHWWEYFRDGRPDDAFIGSLHQTAEYLERSRSDVRVISFGELLDMRVRLN